MEYTIAGITPKDENNFEITFSNRVDTESTNISLLSTNYPIIEESMRDFDEDLKYAIVSITAKDQRKFELIFSNGMIIETANVSLLSQMAGI